MEEVTIPVLSRLDDVWCCYSTGFIRVGGSARPRPDPLPAEHRRVEMPRDQPTRTYHYLVDREGRIFHDGAEIVDPVTLRFFLRAMTRTHDDRWLVVCQGEYNWFEATPTPFVVLRLRLTGHEQDDAVELHLAGGVREPLDPATLFTDGADLFCSIGRDRYPARFGRVALQQLSPLLVGDGEPRLRLNGRLWPIYRAAAPP